MHLVYLSAYSPDFNPIEEGFSALKAWIRQNRDYVMSELSSDRTCDPYQMLWESVFMAMTPEKARGWFSHSGYL